MSRSRITLCRRNSREARLNRILVVWALRDSPTPPSIEVFPEARLARVGGVETCEPGVVIWPGLPVGDCAGEPSAFADMARGMAVSLGAGRLQREGDELAPDQCRSKRLGGVKGLGGRRQAHKVLAVNLLQPGLDKGGCLAQGGPAGQESKRSVGRGGSRRHGQAPAPRPQHPQSPAGP